MAHPAGEAFQRFDPFNFEIFDSIPIVSQLKSAVEAGVFGDCAAAERTQINFSRRCPVVSQARSAVEAGIFGDCEAATLTQIDFLQNGILGRLIYDCVRHIGPMVMPWLEDCVRTALQAAARFLSELAP